MIAVSIPLPVEENNSSSITVEEKSDDCLLTPDFSKSFPADQLLELPAKKESQISREAKEPLLDGQEEKVTQVESDESSTGNSPSSQALCDQTHESLEENDSSVPKSSEAASPHLPTQQEETEGESYPSK